MGPEDQKKLTGAYKRAFDAISSVLFAHDLIGINFEDNTDEYDPEARTILPRLRREMTAEEAALVIQEEFVRWFDAELAGGQERYREVAKEVLQAFRESGI